MGNTFRVTPVFTPRDLTERVKAYIDLEWADETGKLKEANAREKKTRAPPQPKMDPWRNDSRPPRIKDSMRRSQVMETLTSIPLTR